MKSTIIIPAMCALAGLINPAPTQKEMEIADEHIRRILPGATTVERHSFHLLQASQDSIRELSKQRWTGEDVEVWIPFANDVPLGYAVIDNVKGKDQFITYLVIVTPKLVVKDVEILAYRESYGGEVEQSSWLKQFVNKQVTDELKPGKDIRNITGATISARSVTLGVKKVLCLLYVLNDRLPQSPGTGQ